MQNACTEEPRDVRDLTKEERKCHKNEHFIQHRGLSLCFVLPGSYVIGGMIMNRHYIYRDGYVPCMCAYNICACVARPSVEFAIPLAEYTITYNV